MLAKKLHQLMLAGKTLDHIGKKLALKETLVDII